jgi:hypothetical protein
LHSGHLGHRKAHASRPSLDTRPAAWRGLIKPPTSASPLSALAARALIGGGASGCAEPCSSLTDYLPLNLRSLLSQGMRSSMRADERTMSPAGRGPSDAMLREFARAVRSFSAMRAREHWIECAVAIHELEMALAEGAIGGRVPFICLQCAAFAAPDDSQSHREPGCIVASLGTSSPRRSAAERARRAVEKFRAARQAGGLAHYDLDCYVSKGRMVFTWRPPERPSLGDR